MRPTSRLAWVGVGLLVLSVGSFIFSVVTWDALTSLLGPDNAPVLRDFVGTFGILLAGAAAPIVLLASVIARHERSVGAVAGVILGVLWVLFVRAMTTG